MLHYLSIKKKKHLVRHEEKFLFQQSDLSIPCENYKYENTQSYIVITNYDCLEKCHESKTLYTALIKKQRLRSYNEKDGTGKQLLRSWNEKDGSGKQLLWSYNGKHLLQWKREIYYCHRCNKIYTQLHIDNTNQVSVVYYAKYHITSCVIWVLNKWIRIGRGVMGQ